MLPYADPGDVTIWLQDTDTIVGANVSTSLLADDSAIGSLKTRVVASRLEAAGLGTRIIERLFDEHTVPKDSEAVVALAGFDSPQPRRAIDNFEIAIDGGIGAGPHDYLDTVVHTFPAAVPPTDAFPAAAPRVLDPSAPAYTKLIDDAVAAGAAPGDARCGVLDIAGASIGAAFVGAFTAAIAVSAALRVLVDGPYFEVVSVSLRDPAYVDVATGTTPAGFNPGFTALSYCA
jgi:hypothetical protein